MKTITNFLDRIANWKSLLIFLALYLSFPAYFLKNAEAKINELAGNTVGVIDLTMGFDPQKTLDMVAQYGDSARSYYATTEFTTDIAYPLVYAFLFGIILTLLFRGKRLSWVSALPFLTMLLDFAENIAIVRLLTSFPSQSMGVATLCEIFKLLKWLSLGAIFALIIYGLVLRLISRKPISAA